MATKQERLSAMIQSWQRAALPFRTGKERYYMFGLSIKEKLFKTFVRLCEEKLPILEDDLHDLVKQTEKMSEQEAQREYTAALNRYNSAITETIHQALPYNARFRVGAAVMNPTITGLPREFDEEFDSMPFVGKFFPVYYYASTGSRISASDYGKYVRPIDQYQAELVNGLLEKLSR